MKNVNHFFAIIIVLLMINSCSQQNSTENTISDNTDTSFVVNELITEKSKDSAANYPVIYKGDYTLVPTEIKDACSGILTFKLYKDSVISDAEGRCGTSHMIGSVEKIDEHYKLTWLKLIMENGEEIDFLDIAEAKGEEPGFEIFIIRKDTLMFDDPRVEGGKMILLKQ